MHFRIREIASRLMQDERGLTTVEYVIVLCLIAAVAVGAWDEFGNKIHHHLLDASGDIDAALQPG